MERTPEQLLQEPSCVGTVQNVTCYNVAGNTHSNLDTILFIGGFIALIVVAVVVYKLKYGESK